MARKKKQDVKPEAQSAHEYVTSHQRTLTPKTRSGLLQLNVDDFGGNTGSVDLDEAKRLCDAIQAECDRDGLRYYDVSPSDTRMDVEAFARDIQKSLGLVYEMAGQIRAALTGTVEPPKEPPTNPGPTTDSFGDPNHQLDQPTTGAMDLYPNGELGPHDGFRLKAPWAGTVQPYAVMGPADAHEWNPDDLSTPQGTAIWTALYRPDQPVPLRDGRSVRLIGIAHAKSITNGRVNPGDVVCECDSTGIEVFASSQPAHMHIFATQMGNIPPNAVGDVQALLVVEALGFNPRLTRCPGPSGYQSGMYWRGKQRQVGVWPPAGAQEDDDTKRHPATDDDKSEPVIEWHTSPVLEEKVEHGA